MVIWVQDPKLWKRKCVWHVLDIRMYMSVYTNLWFVWIVLDLTAFNIFHETSGSFLSLFAIRSAGRILSSLAITQGVVTELIMQEVERGNFSNHIVQGNMRTANTVSWLMYWKDKFWGHCNWWKERTLAPQEELFY